MSIGLWAQVAVLLMDCYIELLGQVIYRLYTGYVLRVELPVQRRLCPIFVKDVGSPDIHERFYGLMGSQRTPEIWGVTDAIFIPPSLAHVLLDPSFILFVQGRCHLSPNVLFRFLCVETVLENSGK